MKKFTKRTLISAITLITIALSTMPIVFAAHKSPITGLDCNNTGSYYQHNTFVMNVNMDYHVVVISGSNRVCDRTYQVYNHNRRCSGCTYILNTGSQFDCRRTHVYCPTENIGGCVN